MKKFAFIMIGCITFMLAGCQAEQNTESDSVQESEIAVANEMENGAETDEENRTAEDAQQESEQPSRQNTDSKDVRGKISNIHGYDENEQTDKEAPWEKIYRSYPSKTEGLLGVALTTESELCVDLSMKPELWKLVEEDRVALEQTWVNFTMTDEYIQRADSYAYSYLGLVGDGESLLYEGFNYHVESGKKLSLDDIVQDKDALIAALTEQLATTYGASLTIEPRTLAAEFCETGKWAWNIGYQGLTFYADASLVGGGRNQYFSVMVTFAAYPDLFREECRQVPVNYVVAEDIRTLSSFTYDLNEDGIPENINIFSVTGDMGLERIIIHAGDLWKEIKTTNELVAETLSAKDLRCFVLHFDGGKNLIYLHTRYALDGLYYGIILSVSDSDIVILNDRAGFGAKADALIDPCNIMYIDEDGLLDIGEGFFRTVSGNQIDANGQTGHYRNDVEYYLPDTIGFVTVNAFMADRMDIDQEDANAVLVPQDLVPSNRRLRPYRNVRIDGQPYIDFIDEQDGKVYRCIVEIQYDTMEVTLNGTEVKWW